MPETTEAQALDHAGGSGAVALFAGPPALDLYHGAKRLIDALLAIPLLLALAPLLLALALLCRRDGGPAIYGHPRIGRHGRPFRCLKFRSMTTSADAVLARHLAANPQAHAEWQATRKLADDPRITPLGRFLRASSLDELPQLFNVLRGEMSLVGPRPVVQAELDRFYHPRAAAAYLSVRPGITGLWQVSGRSDLDYARRVALDTAYVRDASPVLDARILLRTVLVVLRQQGAR